MLPLLLLLALDMAMLPPLLVTDMELPTLAISSLVIDFAQFIRLVQCQIQILSTK